MGLKAKKPKAIQKRLKLFMYGAPGSGKSMAAIQMPKPYIIDTERGVEQDAYVQLIEKSGGVVLQTNSASELNEELRALLTEPHTFRTVVIDPITNIEDNVVERADIRYNADAKEGGDMRVWRDRDKHMRRTVALLTKLDMNVVMTAHSGILYGDGMTKIGTKAEGWKKWTYYFDLVLELVAEGGKRVAKIRKSRVTGFPQGTDFEWSYGELAKRYGNEVLEKEAAPLALATTEQVAELKRLIETVKLPDDTTEKWLEKAGVEDFADMPADTIAKCIAWVKTRLEGLTVAGAETDAPAEAEKPKGKKNADAPKTAK